jgi:hypothetical protein
MSEVNIIFAFHPLSELENARTVRTMRAAVALRGIFCRSMAFPQNLKELERSRTGGVTALRKAPRRFFCFTGADRDIGAELRDESNCVRRLSHGGLAGVNPFDQARVPASTWRAANGQGSRPCGLSSST